MTTQAIVSIIAILGSLVLAWRGLKSRPMPAGRMWIVALAWVAIIVVAVLIIRALGLERVS